jgi:hypothetical protein
MGDRSPSLPVLSLAAGGFGWRAEHVPDKVLYVELVAAVAR